MAAFPGNVYAVEQYPRYDAIIVYSEKQDFLQATTF